MEGLRNRLRPPMFIGLRQDLNGERQGGTMHCPKRQAYETQIEQRILDASVRLERLRTVAERSAWDGREAFERALDGMRGQQNQALAKLESLRLANDDAWLLLKTQADVVFDRLRGSVGELETVMTRGRAA